MFDMVNLPRQDTGVDGIIYISTVQGQHGPRIKWYAERPARDAPCLSITLEGEPLLVNHGLPARQVRAMEPVLRAWVGKNRVALLDFWSNGISWTRDEVNAFLDGLAKL